MNKELELLESLYIGASRHQAEHGLKVGMALLIQSRYEYLKHVLTPPTADEVCKALSEYSKTNVYYERGGFFYRNEYRYNQPFLVAIKYKSGLIELTKNVLPPHLITMIGKFYESLEGEK